MTINGKMLGEMIVAGASVLEINKKSVDALNVFPVPDGDTGINMSLTMNTARNEVLKTNATSASEVAMALARGALMGARGNSGVILSQIFRGFQRAIGDSEEIDSELFAEALRAASDTAYKAVMKPKEGTILTVMRSMADAAGKDGQKSADIVDLLEMVLQEGEETLKKTPDMLPVLKQAGVVDAGGVGLLLIFTGFKRALDGETLEGAVYEFGAPNVELSMDTGLGEADDNIEFGYCSELFIKNMPSDVNEKVVNAFRDKLERIGDSLIVILDGDLVKVHVHSNMPGKVLQYAMMLGELSGIKIDNMREQHQSLLDVGQAPGTEGAQNAARSGKAPNKEFGMVAVAMGDGFAQIFKDLFVDEIVFGGQTMNPSISDIAEAIKRTGAKNVFVFPNNSNIILAAQQACELVDVNVGVIPTKSIPQGVLGCLAFHPNMDFEENLSRMNAAYGQVKTGQVTYSVRDSSFDGQDIKESDIIGLADGKLSAVGSSVHDVSLDLLSKLVDDTSEIITIYYGQDAKPEDAEALSTAVAERWPDCEVDMYSGGQPVYFYVFSVE